MSEEARLDLSSLNATDVPEVVRPALRRFRLRLFLLAAAVPAFLVTAIALPVWIRNNVGVEQRLLQEVGHPPLGNDPYALVGKGHLADGREWKTFAWGKHERRQDGGLVGCMATITEGDDRATGGCGVTHPGSISGQVVDYTYSEDGEDTRFSGFAPLNVTRLRVEDESSSLSFEVKTVKVPGLKARAFYRILPETEPTDGERPKITAYDKNGNIVPPVPYPDARDDPSLSPPAKKAADQAVAASGTPSAKPIQVEGPITYEQALRSARGPFKISSVSPQTSVFLVWLQGRVTWVPEEHNVRSTRSGRYSEYYYFLIDAASLQPIATFE